jgi:glycyl-tRNA synthetase beta chain
MSAADFLVEIGTEELPPKALKVLSERFAREFESGLQTAGLEFGTIASFATPRRLAVMVTALVRTQPAQSIERRGPAVSAAFTADGKPTPAALGFARSCGVAFEDLARVQTDKGEWLGYRAQTAGRATRDLLPGMVAAALAALPIPKRMRWGARSEEFVRPVHWVVMLHGTEIVAGEILGITSSNETRGHRFMGAARLILASPGEYASRLESEGKVIASFAARRAKVEALVHDAAQALDGRAIMHDDLLDEVTALVEWPAPIVGAFEAHFLQVPREVLIATMQGNQKYFPLEGRDGKLINRFVTISNIESPTPELIRDGNERVIRPRLSDAAFFYAKDRKTSLAARTERLGAIVFERRLGSLLEKTTRVMRLAEHLAPLFNAAPGHAARAAWLSRADLLSEMVGEFPELQGIMGGYYAAHDGEALAVAQALSEFYRPRFAGDDIPTSMVGRCVACADRLDTLLGIFSVGGAPTGDKDPYALRRAALGCLRLCIESDVALDLKAALEFAATGFAGDVTAPTHAVFEFMLERSRAYFAERGYHGDVIEAVLSTQPRVPRDLARRIAAVAAFTLLPQAAALAAANKRIANILKKADAIPVDADLSVLCEPAEVALAAVVTATDRHSTERLAAGEYATYLERLAELHDPINAFFETVLVMAEAPALRAARLALLQRIHQMFLRVADIALITA